ncbi:FtsX-like permease family protein [Stackebrandtia nassauensis]|uniref:ABC3 transporter permease C-terminal domain-containing protein n=1 Tax=Stackebrandtia nassauensis (strain DSM 44728 / CIP 108903 / NRRL B-16338 / NBRC 102104 / LLR-40K-21) TaxID=446470 RepID=D3PYR6_STANL|nr:FtsX-like permease family protein [Stackebrandtia nassauensis]ADD43499.1 protein of unknown function DUF214 [Stackebrandtia nassauensis DSM 44728]
MTNTVTKKRRGVRAWIADVAMGCRFAVAGGPSGWIRAALTALGVGLGVAMLLAAASVPTVLTSMEERQESIAVGDLYGDSPIEKPGDDTALLVERWDSYRDMAVSGTEIVPEGDNPPIPPGIDKLPKPGEMYVSQPLADLLSSEEGKLLKPRLDHKIVGVIADEGLESPGDLRYYAGGENLDTAGAYRIDNFGEKFPDNPIESIFLVLLVIVAVIVMLLPVVMFVAVAVRFGGEQRDRRLAALRLIGADAAAARRIAGGESMFGAIVGLVIGAGLLVAIAQLVESLTFWDDRPFAADIVPDPFLGAIVVIAVPLVAVFATQLAMRRLIVEPLGVVRQAKPRRRRLWWRLTLVVLGVASLGQLVLTGDFRDNWLTMTLVVTGILLLLLGLAAMLPWVVEKVVSRFGAGAPSWQLATRRLQLSGGSASRAIIGVAVAAAGAVALQMLFSTIETKEMNFTGKQENQAELYAPSGKVELAEIKEKVEEVPDVKVVEAYSSIDSEQDASLIVGDCEYLSSLAKIEACAEGDVFSADETAPKPGSKLDFINYNELGVNGKPLHKPQKWTVPEYRDRVTPKNDEVYTSILATPGAVDEKILELTDQIVVFESDRANPDSIEHVRNVAAGVSQHASVTEYMSSTESETFANLRQLLLVGVIATMILIGLSMLVNTLEQLQERRRLMSLLVAFGTRRRTLAFSVLWQTAIPVACGIAAALVTGLGLGWSLIRITPYKPVIDWGNVATIAGAGAAMVLLVTLLSMPALWHMMRPNGIRTE